MPIEMDYDPVIGKRLSMVEEFIEAWVAKGHDPKDIVAQSVARYIMDGLMEFKEPDHLTLNEAGHRLMKVQKN